MLIGNCLCVSGRAGTKCRGQHQTTRRAIDAAQKWHRSKTCVRCAQKGYGSGDGDGSGDGSGDGYGSGDGDGDGSGDGSKEYWLATIDAFASKWPEALRTRLTALRKEGATIAFWRSNADGSPANGGGRIDAPAPGVIHKASGPLSLCSRGTLHATLIPPKWKGDRWWIVAMKGAIAWDDDKCGALEREIIGEAV